MANLSSKIQGVSQAAMPTLTGKTYFTPNVTDSAATISALTDEGSFWEQHGESMLLSVSCSFTTSGTTPTGIDVEIPNGLTVGGTNGNRVQVMADCAALLSERYGAVAQCVQGFQTVGLSTNSGVTYSSVGSGRALRFTMMIPIEEWTGQANIQTANTYQVEYVSNSDTSDADDTTSFVTGMSGSSFPGALTATRSKRVRFAGQIQASDRILIEVNDGNGWVDLAATIFTYNLENSTAAGITYSIVNSTEVDVNFSPYARLNGATFGAAGQAWTAFSTYKYRVRKVSGGIQGFGNATTTTPGLVTLNQLCPATPAVEYTPVWDATSSSPSLGNGSISGTWARDGEDMIGTIDVLMGSTTTYGTGIWLFSLPDGYHINTDTREFTQFYTRVGDASALDASANYHEAACKFYDSTRLNVSPEGAASAVGPTTPFTWTSGDRMSVTFRVPIREWAGSLPGLVSDAQVEFAYNSSTSTTTDTTSFATGTDGVAIQNFAPVGTASVTKRIRFENAVQATDEVVTEVQNGNGGWIPVSQSTFNFTTSDDGATYYGIALSQVSSTDFDVKFYSDPIPGAGWSALSAWSWRVKKVKSSISALVDNATAASYGLVKGGKVPGSDGSEAASAGYVGEVLNFTSRSISAVTSGYTANASALTTLTAGTWLICPKVTGSGTASLTGYSAVIASNTVADGSGEIGTGSNNAFTDPNFGGAFAMTPIVYTVSASTPIYAKAKTYGANTSVIFTGYAVRIA